MHPLEQRSQAAWKVHRARIESDPDEYARRIARRRSATLTRRPRAWCLAIRASDRRITLMHAIITPEHAVTCPPHLTMPHEVTIDTALIQRLCRPWHTGYPFSQRWWLAKQLGVSESRMVATIRRSDRSHFWPEQIDGKRHRKVTVVSSPRDLDPGYAWKFHAPMLHWGTNIRRLSEHAPKNFEQTIRRIPVFRYDPHNRRGGSCRFTILFGYRWICPGCKRRVRTIYYPMPGFCTLRLSKLDVQPGHPDGMPEPPRTFACSRCHDLCYFELATKYWGWNYLVSHLSGGLLYGREVAKPDWWKGERRRIFNKRNRAAPRRQQVQDLLLQGLAYPQIASQMQISIRTVNYQATKIYAQHNVHSHGELAAKLHGIAPKHPKPRQQLVQDLLLQGLRNQDIANRMKVERCTIRYHAGRIYKAHAVQNRQELIQKLSKREAVSV